MPGPEPILRHEGNLRLAGVAAEGVPADFTVVREEVRARLAEDPAEVTCYGPAMAIFERLPAADEDPEGWRCQVGSAVIGQPRSRPPLLIEDFRGLQSLSLPHYGAVRELPAVLAGLADHARAMGWLTRPYWRLSLAVSRAPDGHLVPEALVSLFVDR